MEIIYFLLPLSLVMAVIALIGFFWGVKKNQFDDLDSASIRMLFEDDLTSTPVIPPSTPTDDCNQ